MGLNQSERGAGKGEQAAPPMLLSELASDKCTGQFKDKKRVC